MARCDVTQVFTQKYTIVQFLDHVDVGYEFAATGWPLHVTVVDTFATDWSVDEMAAHLGDTLVHHEDVSSVAGGEQYLGDHRTQVVLLKRSQSLVQLHTDVIGALANGGLILNDPQFAGDGFLPHSTIQTHARLRDGETVKFPALSIVDMFPNGDPYVRRALRTLPVGNRNVRSSTRSCG